MYSMCSIGMRAKQWRAIMGKHLNAMSGVHITNFTYKHIEPMMTRIKAFEGSNYKNLFNTKHGNAGWYLDQDWVSVHLEKYFYYFGKVRGQFESKLPCDRISTREWGKTMALYEKGDINCFADAHIFKAQPYAPHNWRKLKALAVKLFDNQTINDMARYSTVFHKALGFHVFRELEFK